ncbi:MAG TPA: helix-turn-helix domain-containing protein [Natronosporangium sp.]
MQFKPPATRAEARALAHPVRLRIIRLTVDQPLTISELADRLGMAKATVLYHVRTLAREGFLVEQPPRRSAAGRTEKPYRSTHKSLTISLTHVPEFPLAVLDAFRAEVAGHRDPEPVVFRRALRLNDASRARFIERIARLVEEYAGRPDPDGRPVNVLAVAVTEYPATEPAPPS